MMGPPRPPLKPTPARSPPRLGSSRPTGKIVRIPRTSAPASTSTARNIVSTTTTSVKRIPQRTRPSISPPRDSSIPPESTPDPTTSNKRSRLQRENSSNPTPPLPMKNSSPPSSWKRRRSIIPEVDLTPIVPVPTAAAQSKLQEPDPVPEQLIIPSEIPKPSEQEDTTAIEEGEITNLEETGFDRAIMELDVAMTKSTVWIGKALGSILGDLTKLAPLKENRVKFGELIRVSVKELLEPAVKHAEVIGDLGKGLDDAIRRIR